jgi:hypothetical protein
MSTPTRSGAFAYGELLGSIQAGYVRMLEEIAAGMRAARERELARRRLETLVMLNRPLSLEEQEERSQRLYEQGIAQARHDVRRFVRRQFAELRRELGLPQHER